MVSIQVKSNSKENSDTDPEWYRYTDNTETNTQIQRKNFDIGEVAL